jgi:hypothetical protein
MTQEEREAYCTNWWIAWLEAAIKELKVYREILVEREEKFDDWEDCKDLIEELEELSTVMRWDFGPNSSLARFVKRILRDLNQLNCENEAYREIISDLQALISFYTGENPEIS